MAAWTLPPVATKALRLAAGSGNPMSLSWDSCWRYRISGWSEGAGAWAPGNPPMACWAPGNPPMACWAAINADRFANGFTGGAAAAAAGPDADGCAADGCCCCWVALIICSTPWIMAGFAIACRTAGFDSAACICGFDSSICLVCGLALSISCSRTGSAIICCIICWTNGFCIICIMTSGDMPPMNGFATDDAGAGAVACWGGCPPIIPSRAFRSGAGACCRLLFVDCAHGFGSGAALGDDGTGAFDVVAAAADDDVCCGRPMSVAASIMGSWMFSYMRLRALNPSGCASMFVMARSVLRIISRIRFGFAAICIDWRMMAGSFRTWASSGFRSMISRNCGLLWNMLWISSGLSISDCIIGDCMICCIISGFDSSCCCICAMSNGAAGPAPNAPAPPSMAANGFAAAGA